MVPSVPCRGVIEATSISAIEAMACGCGLVASNIGGLSEIVENNVTGILVESGNSGAIAMAINQILNDKTVFSRLSTNASAFVCNELSSEKWFEKHMKVYENLYKIQKITEHALNR